MTCVSVTIQSKWEQRDEDLETADAKIRKSMSLCQLFDTAIITRESLEAYAQDAMHRIQLCHHIELDEPAVEATATGKWVVTFTLPDFTEDQAERCMYPLLNVLRQRFL